MLLDGLEIAYLYFLHYKTSLPNPGFPVTSEYESWIEITAATLKP